MELPLATADFDHRLGRIHRKIHEDLLDVRCGAARRVASAVGEGAMAVAFVNRYLTHG